MAHARRSPLEEYLEEYGGTWLGPGGVTLKPKDGSSSTPSTLLEFSFQTDHTLALEVLDRADRNVAFFRGSGVVASQGDGHVWKTDADEHAVKFGNGMNLILKIAPSSSSQFQVAFEREGEWGRTKIRGRLPTPDAILEIDTVVYPLAKEADFESLLKDEKAELAVVKVFPGYETEWRLFVRTFRRIYDTDIGEMEFIDLSDRFGGASKPPIDQVYDATISAASSEFSSAIAVTEDSLLPIREAISENRIDHVEGLLDGLLSDETSRSVNVTVMARPDYCVEIADEEQGGKVDPEERKRPWHRKGPLLGDAGEEENSGENFIYLFFANINVANGEPWDLGAMRSADY